MTSFLLLVALVSVQATVISVTNGDFSSGTAWITSSATPGINPLKSFTVANSGTVTDGSTGIVAGASATGEL